MARDAAGPDNRLKMVAARRKPSGPRALFCAKRAACAAPWIGLTGLDSFAVRHNLA